MESDFRGLAFYQRGNNEESRRAVTESSRRNRLLKLTIREKSIGHDLCPRLTIESDNAADY